MPMPKLYPDKRVNPTAANFKSKTPVEVSRLPPDFKERYLNLEGRVIARHLHSCEYSILDAAKVFCVPVRVVVEAIENITDDDLGLDALYLPADFIIRFQKPDLFAATNTKTDMRRATKTFAPTEGRRTRSTMKVADKSVVQQMNIRATRRTANTLRVKTSKFQAKSLPTNPPYRRGPLAANHPRHIPLPQPLFCYIPSCQDFIRRVPGVVAYHSSTKFCKKGRAICRIVHPYFESYTAIGIIFGSTHLPVMRAIDNIYGDDKSRDFKEAGEDFKKAFPPIEEETSASKPSGTSLKR